MRIGKIHRTGSVEYAFGKGHDILIQDVSTFAMQPESEQNGTLSSLDKLLVHRALIFVREPAHAERIRTELGWQKEQEANGNACFSARLSGRRAAERILRIFQENLSLGEYEGEI